MSMYIPPNSPPDGSSKATGVREPNKHLGVIMGRNRTVVHLDDTVIASVSEHAVQHHSGSFDDAAEALLLKALSVPAEKAAAKSAPAKKPGKK